MQIAEEALTIWKDVQSACKSKQPFTIVAWTDVYLYRFLLFPHFGKALFSHDSRHGNQNHIPWHSNKDKTSTQSLTEILKKTPLCCYNKENSRQSHAQAALINSALKLSENLKEKKE